MKFNKWILYDFDDCNRSIETSLRSSTTRISRFDKYVPVSDDDSKWTRMDYLWSEVLTRNVYQRPLRSSSKHRRVHLWDVVFHDHFVFTNSQITVEYNRDYHYSKRDDLRSRNGFIPVLPSWFAHW